MAISNEMIQEDKKIVIEILREEFNASEKEIQQFSQRIEDEDPKNWTCGIYDELIPCFEEMREENIFPV